MPASEKRAKPADKKEYDKVVKKVKAAVERWPSAYASGMVVQEYVKAMDKKGKPPYLNSLPSTVGLARWYREDWVDIKTGKPCGAVRTKDYYPVCRPAIRVTNKTPVTASEIEKGAKQKMIKQKQKAKKKIVRYKETKDIRKKNKETKTKTKDKTKDKTKTKTKNKEPKTKTKKAKPKAKKPKTKELKPKTKELKPKTKELKPKTKELKPKN